MKNKHTNKNKGKRQIIGVIIICRHKIDRFSWLKYITSLLCPLDLIELASTCRHFVSKLSIPLKLSVHVKKLCFFSTKFY